MAMNRREMLLATLAATMVSKAAAGTEAYGVPPSFTCAEWFDSVDDGGHHCDCGPVDGTYTISVGDWTSDPIPWDASQGQIAAASSRLWEDAS